MKNLKLLNHASPFVLALGMLACSGSESTPGPTTMPPPTGCTPGTTQGCSAGEICSAEGTCVPDGTTAGALVINAASARACEVLLSSDATAVVGATYATGVQGALRSRPPRYAIAVSQAANQPFAGDAVVLQLDGDSSAVTVEKVNCYDNTGSAITGATASLQ